MQLRYGINPHQAARIVSEDGGPLRVRHGRPSYINLLDAATGWQLVREALAATGLPAAASVKHVSPAGAAVAGHLDEVTRETWGLDATAGPLTSAYARARDADPKSSFGDLIAVSGPVDAELADLLRRVVADGIVAPGFAPGVLAALAAKKGGTFLVLEADPDWVPPPAERRDVLGLTVEQDADLAPITADVLTSEGDAELPPAVVRDALLGMVTARYTQSNSVALVRDGVTLGIGAGQQSRVDCVRLAAGKARAWWLRRHPHVRALAQVPGMSRQDRLNWQLRLAVELDTGGDMTPGQLAQFSRLFPGHDPELDRAERSSWAELLSGVTLVSDGYLPFPDNVEHASRAGVRHIVEPGGSSRSDEVAAACAEHGITLSRTGLRLFRH
jgi:phosphoribosylaminoimidazolecarboxamide formyltransferase/IMP cyclohydrolase